MINYQKAKNILKKAKIKIQDENILIKNSLNRVVSRDVFSPSNHPLGNNAAFDGFAINSKDTKYAKKNNLKYFKIVGSIAAGTKPLKKKIKKFESVEIMTGGIVHKPFNTIIPIEQIIFYPNKKNPKSIIINKKINKYNHVRFKGSDYNKGDIIVKKGTIINSNHILAFKTLGIKKIKVKKKLNILWKILSTAVSICVILFMLNAMKIWPDTRLAYDLPLSTIAALALITYSVVIYKSVENPWKIVTYLLQERRIIFVLILLGILFYIDNVFMYGHPTGNGIAFPLLICVLLSFDFLCCHFPRKITIITWTVSLLVLFWNIVDKTFVKTDCEVKKLPWGYMGTKVSYCNITRLIYQSILSLLLPAAFATLAKRTDNLFYCNANLYRSTGTTHRTTVNENTYVVSMTTERSFSKKKNVLGDKNVPGRARV